MREVADTHRELYAEHADLYGDERRLEDRALPRRSPTRSTTPGCARARALPRAVRSERWTGSTCSSTPTLPFVAPPCRPGRAGAPQPPDAAHLAVQRRSARPRSRCPCGPAEDGLPASVQLVGRHGDDALVLAAGELLAARCSSARAQLPTNVQKQHVHAPDLACSRSPRSSACRPRRRAPLAAPTGLHAFLLRADEPRTDRSRGTPSFAWTPYDSGRAATTSSSRPARTFDESAIVWSTDDRDDAAAGAALAIPLALPWMTGNPYALYAHVRARTRRRASPAGARRSASTCAGRRCPTSMLPDDPRPRPLEAGRGRHLLRGLVRRRRQGDHDDDERRRRARVLQLPRRIRPGPASCSGASAPSASCTARCRTACRSSRSGRGARHSSRPTRRLATGPISLSQTRLGRDQHGDDAGRAQPDARVRLQRRHGDERHRRPPLPRLRRDRPAVREHRLHRARSSAAPPTRRARAGRSRCRPRPRTVTAAQTAYLSDGAQAGTFTADLRP